jgi:hypothetical protein
MTQKEKVLEILKRVDHLGDVGGGAILKKNNNRAIIPQDGEGAMPTAGYAYAPKNQLPITLLQSHLLHGGGALEE